MTTRAAARSSRTAPASPAAVPGYEVAGKTGTAQKARTDGRGYADGRVRRRRSPASCPPSDPRLVIVVTIDEPTKGIYGGTVAAPSFAASRRFAVAHLKIPPVTTRAAGARRGAGNGAVSKPATPGRRRRSRW